MRVTPKCARTSKRKMKLTWYYCSKYRTDDTDHQYENCPTWQQCGFCDRQGHWSFHCTMPHVKCMRYRCGVHVGHCNIGDMCPWSKEVKRYNFGYDCEGAVVDLVRAREIYRPELDWSSVTTFPPSAFPYAYLPEPHSYLPPCQPRHLPLHCHTSLHHHLPTWLFFILISDPDSLCLPSYLQRPIRYSDPSWQAFPRPFLYLTLASTMTKP